MALWLHSLLGGGGGGGEKVVIAGRGGVGGWLLRGGKSVIERVGCGGGGGGGGSTVNRIEPLQSTMTECITLKLKCSLLGVRWRQSYSTDCSQ